MSQKKRSPIVSATVACCIILKLQSAMTLSFKLGDPFDDFLRKRNVNTSRWEDYFLEDRESDLTISLDGLSIPGHGFVFKDRCPNMYDYYDMWSNNEIKIDNEDFSNDAIVTIVRFIYRGDIVFQRYDLEAVLHMARKYEIDDLFNRLTSHPNFGALWNEFAWSYLNFIVTNRDDDDEEDDGSDDYKDNDDSDCDDSVDDGGNYYSHYDYYNEYDDEDEEFDDDNDGHDEDDEDWDDEDGDDDEDEDNEYDSFCSNVWEKIRSDAEALVALDGFSHLSEDAISELLADNKVRAYETSLFNACLRWAEVQCSERDWKDVSANWRKLMQPFIHRIRFTRMSVAEFRSGPKCSGVLHERETRQIEAAILSGNVSRTPFDHSDRTKPATSRPKSGQPAGRATSELSADSYPSPGPDRPSASLPVVPVASGPNNGCKICFTEEIGIMFRPCGHVAVCQTCSRSLRECPVCRSKIKQKLRAFLS